MQQQECLWVGMCIVNQRGVTSDRFGLFQAKAGSLQHTLEAGSSEDIWGHLEIGMLRKLVKSVSLQNLKLFCRRKYQEEKVGRLALL